MDVLAQGAECGEGRSFRPRRALPATAGSMCQYWNDLPFPAGDGYALAGHPRDLSRGDCVCGSAVGRVDVDALVEGEDSVAEERLVRSRLGEPCPRVPEVPADRMRLVERLQRPRYAPVRPSCGGRTVVAHSAASVRASRAIKDIVTPRAPSTSACLPSTRTTPTSDPCSRSPDIGWAFDRSSRRLREFVVQSDSRKCQVGCSRHPSSPYRQLSEKRAIGRQFRPPRVRRSGLAQCV